MNRLTVRRASRLLLLLWCGTQACSRAHAEEPAWKAGVARAVVTPTTPVWLAGYAGQREPDGKLHDLWVKALALESPDGGRAVLITSDFQGVPKSMSDRVFARLHEEHGLDRSRVMFTFSHNHCSPRLGDDLIDYYPVDVAQEALVQQYTDTCVDACVALVGDALRDLAPATLRVGAGRAGFAVNRRENPEASVPGKLDRGEPLRGPTDHDVPVMTVTRPDDRLAAILFGYACHPTTLNFRTYCGDYPGFAQAQLERSHPGATALFVNTCGGDQNPLPRRSVELCERYGTMLAAGVEEALRQPTRPVRPALQVAFEMVSLDYEQVVTRRDLEIAAEDKHPIKARWGKRMLGRLAAGETFAASYPYPIHAWRLGDETRFIGMGAETVVDYALKLKQQYRGGTWVLGYTDDMLAYIPSRRVWDERGYEGGSSLFEYGRPALRWAGTIEDRITAAVGRLVEQTNGLAAVAPAAGSDADYAADLPRVAPIEPAAAAATLRIQPGFTMQLAACEPLVASPVAMAWDEDGRLFVAEMRSYSERQEESLGRIRVLHDDDDDGDYDRAVVFADNLAWPTAICCWRGGVFVGDAPDLLYLKDTDGDGRADERRRVFTGFSTGNVQGLLNSLTFGLDNRIHGSASSTGGKVRRIGDGEPLDLGGRDFSFAPDAEELRTETGGAQHGLGFDDWGRKYICHNSDHAICCMIEDRYLARNPWYTPPSAKASIAADGPQAAVFRASPVEPWRLLRTRLRGSGIVPGLVEQGGRASGYFTSATGITAVRGDAFGPELSGMLIVGDVGSNLIHRKRVRQDGAGVVAERVDEGGELVASTDIWFRPVQFANGPDGALWCIDMYREVIEHPGSLVPQIKQHLDLDSGRDRGRIWRLTPEDFRRRSTPRMSGMSTLELVDALSHPNAWHRQTAARLIFERRDPAAMPMLAALAMNAAVQPLARLHALHALEGGGSLEPAHVLSALNAAEPRLRAASLSLAERFVAAGDGPLISRLVQMAAEEPDASVRFRLALSAGFLPDPERAQTLSRLLARDGSDPWCRIAAFTSLHGEAGTILVNWLSTPDTLKSTTAWAVLPGLATQVGRRHDAADLSRVMAAIEPAVEGTDPQRTAAATLVVTELAAALRSSGGSVAAIEPAKQSGDIIARLNRVNAVVAADPSAVPARRVAAIRGLALAPLADVGATLMSALASPAQQDVADAALEVLDRSQDATVASLLIGSWQKLPPRVRAAATSVLADDGIRATALLAAIRDGKIHREDIDASAVDSLRNFPSASVRSVAVELFGSQSSQNRDVLVESYRAAMPVQGDPLAGREVFTKNCSGCHRVEGVGREIGPNLAAMRARGAEATLLGVLDPNREVQPQYVAHVAVTDDGRVVTGVVASQSSASITLRTADGKEETLAREDLEEFRPTGRSLMPEGFERQIHPRSMADLMAYLTESR